MKANEADAEAKVVKRSSLGCFHIQGNYPSAYDYLDSLGRSSISNPADYSALDRIHKALLHTHGSTFASLSHRRPEESSADSERQEKEVQRLREENEQLKVQNQLLQTRVAEMRRSLNREGRHSEWLREHTSQLLSELNKCQDLLSDRERMNDSIVAKMASAENGQVLMHESYEGQVQHVGETTAVVVYDVEGDLVEQTYEREQFTGRELPAVGTCVRVLVFVVGYKPEPPSDEELEQAINDQPSGRKPITGPIDI